jgi:predicted ATPase/DNA-binding SARP family transcriptional activator
VLEIHLLGHFSLKSSGDPVEISSRSAQSLLGYLLLNRGIAHRREKLAGLLWPDATEANARSYLRKALWQVRKSLVEENSGGEEYLIVDDLTITFNSNANYWLDVDVLESSNEETSSVEEQIESVSVYQGELLPGFYEDWVILERERLQALFEHKLQVLLDRFVEEGRWSETLDWGERWIALGSVPEPAYRAMLIAYAALGDNAKVVGTYDRCVQTLREELGVEPSEQTRELYEQILSGKVIISHRSQIPIKIHTDEIETDSSPQETSDRRVSNLPVPLTSFIGRKDEIKEIRNKLLESRLLILSGAGGSGKTRLAIQVADEMRGMFRDGMRWIDLGAIIDPNLVPQVIAKVLRVREVSHQSLMESLANSLQSKEILLVLDNCEHLLDACAQLTEFLLKACPSLKILATSREVLGIAGERVFPVPTMSAPDPNQVDPSTFYAYDAVRLFDERAKSQMPDFVLTDQNALAVAQLLFELDGIPLAIELAAARVQALKVEQIAARLDDRFRLLTGGSRTALPHHQTLLATLDWSYDLLTSNEQTVLQRLSVFTGGWSVAAGESVCTGGEIQPEDVLDLLSLLANKSLVLTERRPGEEARYRMLETIREYAGVKLSDSGDETMVRDRHLEFFVALAEQAEPQLSEPNQLFWLNRLEIEHENLRSAVIWSLEQKAATPALSLVSALSWFWYTHGHYYEARELSLQLLSSSFTRGRTAARVRALSKVGFVLWALDRKTDVSPMLEEALDIANEIGERFNIAWARVFLGIVTSTQSDHEEALSHMEQGLEEYKALDSAGKYEVGFALTFLGDGYFFNGDYQRAQEVYETSVDILSEIQDQNVLAYALRRVGHTARYRGALEEADKKCRQSLRINQKLGHMQAVAACINAFACIAVDRGESKIAAQLFAAVEKQLEVLGHWLMPADNFEFERNLALAREALGEEEFATAWAKGRSMTTKQALALALKQTSPQE